MTCRPRIAVERADGDEPLAVVEDPAADRDLARLSPAPCAAAGTRPRRRRPRRGSRSCRRRPGRCPRPATKCSTSISFACSPAAAAISSLVSTTNAAVGELVALDDLVVGDLLVLLRADLAVLDARAVGEVHLVEVDALGLGRRVDLDRDVDEPEGDRAVPDRAGRHGRDGYPASVEEERDLLDRRAVGHALLLARVAEMQQADRQLVVGEVRAARPAGVTPSPAPCASSRRARARARRAARCRTRPRWRARPRGPARRRRSA